jgi:hypothetical protein
MPGLRLPSRNPGYWIYLRDWTVYGEGESERAIRTWGNTNLITADQHTGMLNLPLENHIEFTGYDSCKHVRDTIDAYLKGRGAEPVPPEEWPAGCYGASQKPTSKIPYVPPEDY